MRIISAGIEKASHARIEIARLLADLGYNKEVVMPDIDTKEKAQLYLGYDMDKLNASKENWIENELPAWLEIAAERENKMPAPKRIN